MSSQEINERTATRSQVAGGVPQLEDHTLPIWKGGDLGTALLGPVQGARREDQGLLEVYRKVSGVSETASEVSPRKIL